MTANNFEFLKAHDSLLLRLAQTAEACYVPDPNTTLVKMRQLGEELAKTLAARVGVETGKHVKQVDLLRELHYTLRLAKEVQDAFHTLRKLGNDATHDITSASHRDALKALQVGYALSVWFHKNFGGDAAKKFEAGKFVKPADPSEHVRQLEAKIAEQEKRNISQQQRIAANEALQTLLKEKALAETERAQQMEEEREIWEALATENETKLVESQTAMAKANDAYKAKFDQQSQQQQASVIQRIEKTSLQLTEAETRVIIDQQLIDAGWQADSVNLRYSQGARPVANENRAIAEWPCHSGPADYVLFMGLTPVAIIEAKRKSKNVYSAIDQAKNYAKQLKHPEFFEAQGQQGKFAVPLVFATNGRPYLEQLKQESGIWFLDVRDNTNRRRALPKWHTPSDIKNLLRQTAQQADSELESMDFNYHLELRDYQISAIKAVENSIKQGERRALVSMATGTGKTKTAIALMYRLLKAERFHRILFLVDRSALGVQTTDDFDAVRLEGNITFSDSLSVMGMVQNKPVKPTPDEDTKVHVATVQGLVKRLLYAEDDSPYISPGQYDCIIVDECHRGYLLDQAMGDTELLFRNQQDYQSKYRSVIDYFDAVKIGLTATPAQHTSEIFGPPVFNYSYTEAVIDGYLNDQYPTIGIHTTLSDDGIHYAVNEEVTAYAEQSETLVTYNTPDELDFEVADFNRKITAKSYTKAVIEWLINNDKIDPYSRAKTLVFCVTDKHADDVVEAFKDAIENYHGEVEDDAVQKITGSIKNPLEAIRHFRSDRLPNIVVTVDLLTTGVDVRSICNLVFLRRVNSRILYEQMIGRATRLCPEIGKGPFRVYDAVDIYKKLEKVNTMKPVATKADITFSKLSSELAQNDAPDLQELARQQFLAKFQVKKQYLSDDQRQHFETIVGKPPAEFAKELKAQPLHEVAEWFTRNPMLGELLDQKVASGSFKPDMVIYEGEDAISRITTGYGDGQKPEDYLQAFNDFVNANSNRLAAIQTVVNSPWQLNRQSLKELAVELEQHHFREKDLQTAWQEVKQEDIAARIIGFIRQAALGEALIPWDERVDKALESLLNSRPWKTPQKKWLQLMANQIKATTVVDQSALNQGIFKHNGGIKRANKLFDQPVQDVLADLNRAMWP